MYKIFTRTHRANSKLWEILPIPKIPIFNIYHWNDVQKSLPAFIKEAGFSCRKMLQVFICEYIVNIVHSGERPHESVVLSSPPPNRRYPQTGLNSCVNFSDIIHSPPKKNPPDPPSGNSCITYCVLIGRL